MLKPVTAACALAIAAAPAFAQTKPANVVELDDELDDAGAKVEFSRQPAAAPSDDDSLTPRWSGQARLFGRMGVDLAQDQTAAVGGDIAAIKLADHFTRTQRMKFDRFRFTLCHQKGRLSFGHFGLFAKA